MLKPNQPTLPNARTTTPSELFGDFVEDLAEKYEKDKRLLKDLVKDSGIIVHPGTSYEEFEEAITSHAKLETFEDKAHIHRYFDALKEKAIQKEKSNEKRKRKMIDNFVSYLKRSKVITVTSTWPDVLEELSRQPHPLFEELPIEEREKAFNEYFQQFKAKLELEANENSKPKSKHRSSEKSDKSEKRHKKRRRKSSKRRDSDSDVEPHHHNDDDKRHSKRQKSEDDHESNREKHKEKDRNKEKDKSREKDKHKDKDKDKGKDKDKVKDKDKDKEKEKEHEKENKDRLDKDPNEKEKEKNEQKTSEDDKRKDEITDNLTQSSTSQMELHPSDQHPVNADNDDKNREKTLEKEDGELVGDPMEQ